MLFDGAHWLFTHVSRSHACFGCRHQHKKNPPISIKSDVTDSNMDNRDHYIGFVSLDVAAAPTKDFDAETHQNDPAKSLPTIMVEDTSPDSQLLIEKEGFKNKISIYLAGNKQEDGYMRFGLGPIDSRITKQLAEQVAAKAMEPGFLNEEQKEQLKKIVIQHYSTTIASVHFLASNKRLLSARDIPLTIRKSEDDGKKLEASSVDAREYAGRGGGAEDETFH
ncbi:hypothetical protein IWZ03DRAFT_196857 [Phyllosticta citriasiana]|uniref:Uncharacterized protein n=1 Tax=Phyllosticta citriasiana TaxID=595635 RepID=A0ABR1KNC3_9PEZI